MNEYEEKIKHYELLAKDYNHDMLVSVIDFSKMGLKAAFLLNGSAAISVLTLFTKALIELPEVSSSILNAVYIFAIGAMLSALAVIAAYFTQLAFQKNCNCNNNRAIYSAMYDKVEAEDKERIKKHLLSVAQLEKLAEESEKKRQQLLDAFTVDMETENKSNRQGDMCRNIALFLIALSFLAFFGGIYMTKNAFDNVHIAKEQITFYEFSYPNVQVKPLSSATKTN